MNKDFKEFCETIDKQMLENEKQAQAHIQILKKSRDEERERGCAEYANLLVSLYNHQYVGHAEDN